jgi:hypothetical protein
MTTSIIFFLIIAGLIAAWVCYMLIKSHEVLKDIEETNAPYKVEPPKYTEQLAVPHKPIEWTFANAPEKQELRNIQFDPMQPPKRKYTKRSKYWAKKKKVAKKKTRKSK